jgi:predicted dehydrogenase
MNSKRKTNRRTNRRSFLQQSSGIGVAFWVWGNRISAADRSPNEKINVACIGVAGKGNTDSNNVGELANVVAICDIDEERGLAKKKIQFPQAKAYTDFRKMLDDMGSSIDAVTVSTPDHTHAAAAMMAIKMGKHVYCQKPLTHTIHEARAMREAAAKYKVVTQMGNQGSTSDGLRRCVELIQAGAIGSVREVHVWTNRPGWPQAPQIVARPTEIVTVPPTVHWDLFLGPAPERPYNPCYHPKNWRGWWDFGTGALGDMGCHTANMPFMALKLGYPTSVVAQSGEVNPETYPSWASIQWDFPARGELPPVKFKWYEGKKIASDGAVQMNLPSADLFKGEAVPSSGSLLVGDKGTLFAPGDGDNGKNFQFKLLPEKDFAQFEGPAPTLARNGGSDLGQKREWLDAIKGGPTPFSNFAYAGLLTETILLGNLAIRVGKKIEWDGPNMQATNAPEAAQYISPEYRKGWSM